MNNLKFERSIYILGIVGAITAFSFLGIALTTGVSQEPFQAVRAPGEYVELLKTNASILRAVLTIDNFFIVLYTTFFTLFAVALRKEGQNLLTNIALGAILIAGFLDALENFHIFTMLTSSLKNLDIGLTEIQAQMVITQLKFLSSYTGLFLFAFALQGATVWERILMRLFWFVQLPVGILALTAPPSLIKPLVIGRGLFFIAGFLVVSKIFSDRIRERAKTASV